MAKKKEGCAALKKKLDNVFSQYIRMRDHGICFTCGKVGEIKEMQAGHYVSRACLPLRYDEKNVHCQCFVCNCMKHGELITYRENLVGLYGEKEVERLELMRHHTAKFTAEKYKEMLDYYSNRVKVMSGG